MTLRPPDAMTTRPAPSDRINARLGRDHAAKLDALRRTTRRSVSDLVKRGIDLVYAEVQSARSNPLEVLTEHGFVGSGTGPADLSERYKEELLGLLASKHGHR